MSKKIKPIVFYNAVAGYAESYPIIEAKNYKRDWVEKNAKDLHNFRNDTLKKCPMQMLHKVLSQTGFVSKCPGIREFMNAGYILQTPCDFILETNGDGETINVFDLSPSQGGMQSVFKVKTHPSSQLHAYTPNPENSLKSIVKVLAGWAAIPDERYVFLVTPVLYSGESRFSAAFGIWDPFIDTQFNTFLFWHVLKGRETVKAGTPLVQLIPLDRNFQQAPVSCRTATEEDVKKQFAMQTINKASLDTNYRDARRKVVKKIYNTKY